MKNFIKTIKKREYVFQEKMEYFFSHHNIIGFFAAFIGMPVATLSGVFALTAALAYPMALIFGWI